MNETKDMAMLEAMLFASGESVPVKRLAEVMEIGEKAMQKMLDELKKKYDEDLSRGITLMKLEDSYQLCSKKDYHQIIRILTEKKRKASLTNAGLEVLSVVAYNQPVTRSSIEFIRGVNSDGALNNLIAAGLVEEVGRLDAPGKPILFGTSEEFLRCFNLSSISQLPDVDFEYNYGELNRELVKGEQMEFENEESEELKNASFDINDDLINDSENKESEIHSDTEE